MEKPTIVILSGTGAPAVAAANIYHQRLCDEYKVLLISETNLTVNKIWHVLKIRLRKQGWIGVLNLLALRIWFLIRKGSRIPRNYDAALNCLDINMSVVIDFIKEVRPIYVITNACSILRKPLLNEIDCPILNVHNGVTPRYRGTGNFWAVHEDNPMLLGTTVHKVDQGIDTGARVAVRMLDPLDPRLSSLESLDIASLEDGANMICDHILHGMASIPVEVAALTDGYYSYPGLSHYLRAAKILKRWRSKRVLA